MHLEATHSSKRHLEAKHADLHKTLETPIILNLSSHRGKVQIEKCRALKNPDYARIEIGPRITTFHLIWKLRK